MAINQWSWLGNVVSMLETALGTKLHESNVANIAEADRVSRETIASEQRKLDQLLREEGYNTDILRTLLSNASNEDIARLKTSSEEYITWLKENGLNERLTSSQAHDKWVTAYKADASYFNNLLSAVVDAIGKSNISNIGLQSIPAITAANDITKLFSENMRSYLNSSDGGLLNDETWETGFPLSSQGKTEEIKIDLGKQRQKFQGGQRYIF